MMKKQKQGFSRRQFLSMFSSLPLGALTASPLAVLSASLVEGALASAQVGASKTKKARNYVFVGLPGGPPRWYWDLLLKPIPALANPFVANRQVTTSFASQANETQYTGSSFVTNAVTSNGVTYDLPSLWSCDIPTSSGPWVPMTSLWQHMITVRGIDMQINTHGGDYDKQARPSNASASIAGLVADRSDNPISSVALWGSQHHLFRSEKGLGQTYSPNLQISGNHGPLTDLLSPFVKSNAAVQRSFSRRDSIDQLVQNALAALNTSAAQKMPGTASLDLNRGAAEKLFKQGFGDLNQVWSTLVEKYRRLISLCWDPSHPIFGVNDKPVMLANSTNEEKVRRSYENYKIGNADLRTIIDDQTGIRNLAENFAIAEYVITQKLSSSVMLGVGGTQNMNWMDTFNGSITGNFRNVIYNLDEHGVGQGVSLIVNSFYFRALTACLYEFVQALKQTDDELFSETVIHVGSEFSRTPRDDASGSDHAWPGNVLTMISGAIKKPMVIGNVDPNPEDPASAWKNIIGYKGSWGAAGPVKTNSGETLLHMGYASSTLAHLLRIKAPMANFSSLISEDPNSGAITSQVDEPQSKVRVT
jgi:hypothetical protein